MQGHFASGTSHFLVVVAVSFLSERPSFGSFAWNEPFKQEEIKLAGRIKKALIILALNHIHTDTFGIICIEMAVVWLNLTWIGKEKWKFQFWTLHIKWES